MPTFLVHDIMSNCYGIIGVQNMQLLTPPPGGDLLGNSFCPRQTSLSYHISPVCNAYLSTREYDVVTLISTVRE